MDWLPLALAGLALAVGLAALGAAALALTLVLARPANLGGTTVVNVTPEGGFLLPVPDSEDEEDDEDPPLWGDRFSGEN